MLRTNGALSASGVECLGFLLSFRFSSSLLIPPRLLSHALCSVSSGSGQMPPKLLPEVLPELPSPEALATGRLRAKLVAARRALRSFPVARPWGGRLPSPVAARCAPEATPPRHVVATLAPDHGPRQRTRQFQLLQPIGQCGRSRSTTNASRAQFGRALPALSTPPPTCPPAQPRGGALGPRRAWGWVGDERARLACGPYIAPRGCTGAVARASLAATRCRAVPTPCAFRRCSVLGGRLLKECLRPPPRVHCRLHRCGATCTGRRGLPCRPLAAAPAASCFLASTATPRAPGCWQRCRDGAPSRWCRRPRRPLRRRVCL